MKKIIIGIIISSFLMSCSNWLDVDPKDQTAATEQFDTYEGFRSALYGCYIQLKSKDLYGEKLTMSAIECMAQMWKLEAQMSSAGYYELSNFDYSGDNAKGEIRAIYENFYNCIAQANMILKYISENGDVIPNRQARDIIEAEAYAIRAFCHFDILRLFGQVPHQATILKRLPYATEVSIKDVPLYFGYEDFVRKIGEDLDKAEGLLSESDPIFTNTFNSLNNPGSNDDDFLFYRQNRFNYWAVKALKARYYMYLGGENTSKAYSLAMEIIEAEGADGNPLIELSGSQDITSGFLACPSECLLMLNVYDLNKYVPSVLGSGLDRISFSNLALEMGKFPQLWGERQGIASNNRYTKVWKSQIPDPSGRLFAVLYKYYYETSGTGNDRNTVLVKNQVIPLIRLSEMYLIAMETTDDLDEANSLWVDYMLSHDVQANPKSFGSLTDVKNEIEREYLREFYGEGQMFYTYKRLGATSMLWYGDTVEEANYVVPLPDTEYDPNLK